MFKYPLYLFCALVMAFTVTCHAKTIAKKVSIKQFGAVGDGKHNDTQAFVTAIKSNANIIVIPKGTYNIAGPITFKNLVNKTIIATGAIIQNTTLFGTLTFDKGKQLALIGGTWRHYTDPKEEGPLSNEHTFVFVGTSNIKVTGVTIDGSPQMGICMIGVINATISKNIIQKCYRDGIYSHYSAKINISYNQLNNIKDDAISMHDYGIKAQKPELIKAKLMQAGYSTIKYNRVDHAFQGFSSIGCTHLTIINNKVSHTVNAGIAVFNSQTLFKGSTARANNIIINNNTLSYNGGEQTIIGQKYQNGGQLSSGRAAIFVTDVDEQNLINNHKTRIAHVRIANNIINNSYVNGAYVAEIDDLTFINNSFTNCQIDRSKFTGRIVEIIDCTKAVISTNKVIDDRTKPLHDSGYQVQNVSGSMSGWTIKGFGDKVQGYIIKSSLK